MAAVVGTVIDVRTPLHFAVGVAAGAVGIDPSLATLAMLSYEAAAEAARARDAHRALFSRGAGDTRANTMVDVAAGIIGVFVGRALRQRYEAQQTARALTELQRAETTTSAEMAGLGQPGYAPWADQFWRQ